MMNRFWERERRREVAPDTAKMREATRAAYWWMPCGYRRLPHLRIRDLAIAWVKLDDPPQALVFSPRWSSLFETFVLVTSGDTAGSRDWTPRRIPHVRRRQSTSCLASPRRQHVSTPSVSIIPAFSVSRRGDLSSKYRPFCRLPPTVASMTRRNRTPATGTIVALSCVSCQMGPNNDRTPGNGHGTEE